MTTFVLVPGAWAGAWAWDAVAGPLRAGGATVHALTLTGLAERAGEASPATDWSTHVADVERVLVEGDLRDVVLVGHSYAGSVVTAAAERVPERVARLVYVDTGPLPDGWSQADFEGPEQWERRQATIRDGFLPPPTADELPPPLIEGVDWAGIADRLTPQPVRTYTEKAVLRDVWERLPRTAVLSSFTEEQVHAMAAERPVFALMAKPGWAYESLPTGHWPMFSRPADLAEVLSRVAAG